MSQFQSPVQQAYQPPMPSAPSEPKNQTMKSLSITFFAVSFGCGLFSLAFAPMLVFAGLFQITAFVCLCLI